MLRRNPLFRLHLSAFVGLLVLLISSCGPLEPYTPSGDQLLFIDVRERTWNNGGRALLCDPYVYAYSYDPEQGLGLSPDEYDRLGSAALVIGHHFWFIGCGMVLIAGSASTIPFEVGFNEGSLEYLGPREVFPLKVELLAADGWVQLRYGEQQATLSPGTVWGTGPLSTEVEGITYTTIVTITNYGLLDRATQVHRGILREEPSWQLTVWPRPILPWESPQP